MSLPNCFICIALYHIMFQEHLMHFVSIPRNMINIIYVNSQSMTLLISFHCISASVMHVWRIVLITLLDTKRLEPTAWHFGWHHFKWASYQIRKIAGCACAGITGNVFPATRFQRKSLVSDHGRHHGTCVTGSLTHGGRKIVPGIPGACATPNFTYLIRGTYQCFSLGDQLTLSQHWFLKWLLYWSCFVLLWKLSAPLFQA